MQDNSFNQGKGANRSELLHGQWQHHMTVTMTWLSLCLLGIGLQYQLWVKFLVCHSMAKVLYY